MCLRAGASQRREDLHAGPVAEHQVQDDAVRLDVDRGGDRGIELADGCDHGAPVVVLEQHRQQVEDVRLVINHENAPPHDCDHRLRLPPLARVLSQFTRPGYFKPGPLRRTS